MLRHDHLWKNLLKAFLPEFLELVLPEALERYQVHRATYLEQEAFRDPLGGTYSAMDLVAQLPPVQEGPPGLLLVHIEIERQFGEAFGPRMLEYFQHLRLKHRDLVLPIVLFLRGGPAGVTRRQITEELFGFEVLRFTYWAFGLTQAAAEDYLGRNSLTPALAACMGSRVWRPSERKLECLLSILESEVDDSQRFLLVNAVQTYLVLAEEDEMSYAELVEMSTRGQEVKSMEMTWADKIEHRAKIQYLEQGRNEGLRQGRNEGLRQGRNEGRSEGAKKVLGHLLEERFGPLDRASWKRFEAIDDEGELADLGKRLLSAASLADLGLKP